LGVNGEGGMHSKSLNSRGFLSPSDKFFFIYYGNQMATYLRKSRSQHFKHIATQWLAQFEKKSELLFKSAPPEEFRVWEILVDVLDPYEYHVIPFKKVAQKTGLKKPNIVRAVKKLVNKGFIKKQSDSTKKRYQNYRLIER
jgi:RIO-like serine/threonine protein kinase